MNIYRVLRPLSTGQQPGELVNSDTFKPHILDVLLKVRALSIAQGPPLSELPGWARRAEKLAGAGILNVSDLLSADPERLQRLFGHKRTATVSKWQKEAARWLVVDTKPRRKSR